MDCDIQKKWDITIFDYLVRWTCDLWTEILQISKTK